MPQPERLKSWECRNCGVINYPGELWCWECNAGEDGTLPEEEECTTPS